MLSVRAIRKHAVKLTALLSSGSPVLLPGMARARCGLASVRTRPFGQALGRWTRALLGLVALGGGSLVSGRAAPAPEVAAAIALYDEGSYSAAQIRFDAIARVRPNDPEIDLYRGRLALWLDDSAAGLAFEQKAVQAAPDDARMQNAYGDACGLTARRSGFFSKYGWA